MSGGQWRWCGTGTLRYWRRLGSGGWRVWPPGRRRGPRCGRGPLGDSSGSRWSWSARRLGARCGRGWRRRGNVGKGARDFGLLTPSIQLGNAWGLGLVATVVAATTLGDGSASSEALVGGLRWGALACVGFAGVALPVVLLGLPG